MKAMLVRTGLWGIAQMKFKLRNYKELHCGAPL